MSQGAYVYVISTVRVGKVLGPCKCGITSNPKSRLATLQTGNPNTLVLSACHGPFARAMAAGIETEIHSLYQRYRMRGEWFSVDPLYVVDAVGDAVSILRHRGVL